MDARQLVAETSDLASLPEVAARVIGLAEDPRSTAAQFAAVISRDTNLAARLLRVANSSYYSMSGRIDTIPRAVTVIGSRQVRDLTLGLSAIRVFQGIPIEVISMDDFWSHSLYTALIARRLAGASSKALEDTAFVAGLLHDVGQLLLVLRVPDLARKSLWLATEGPEDLTLADAERQVLGFDHGDVGLELARKWNLPEVLRECIAHHHEPGRASIAHAGAVAIVHVANSLAYLAETDSLEPSMGPAIAPAAARLAGFQERDIPQVVSETRAQIDEVRALFGL